jgi:hypothetical protein
MRPILLCKAIIIINSECVCVCVCVCACAFVALFSQHGKCMRHIIMSSVVFLAVPYFST